MKQRIKRVGFCITILTLGIILSPVFASTSQAASSYNNMRVASGDDHALMIDTDGNVWAFGDNSKGQLGDLSLISKEAPVMIYSKVSQGKAVSVAAGVQPVPDLAGGWHRARVRVRESGTDCGF